MARRTVQLWLDQAETSTLLRVGVLGLAGLGTAGLLVELAFLRHWSSAAELIVWPALAVVAVGLAGMWFHVSENLVAGPLDRAYATTWDTLSSANQWFLAITGGVGPAPALAPGSMSELGLAIALGTFRHPALSRGGAGDLVSAAGSNA